MRVELEHVVAHPPDRVFAFMSVPSNRPLWQENTESVELVSVGEARVGTRWREVMRGVGPVEQELVALEPGVLWEEAGRSQFGTGRVRVEFAPAGDDATRVRVCVELRPRGTKRLLEPALALMVRRQMPRDLDRLGEILASAHAQGGA